MPGSAADPFDRWLLALEKRHLADRTFQEVRRALQALSSLYVERRDTAPLSDAYHGAGKRAAYALFYGPLHFLTVREIVRAAGAAGPPPRTIVDLGCGTGAGGAAWALEAGGRSEVRGIDRNSWAVEEANRAYLDLGLHGRARTGDALRLLLPGRGDAVLAAYVVNELGARERDRLLASLLDAADRGARVLVIEPVSRRVAPWWDTWSAAFLAAGGVGDTRRFRPELPNVVKRLDDAAGLDHGEIAARGFWLDGTASDRRGIGNARAARRDAARRP